MPDSKTLSDLANEQLQKNADESDEVTKQQSPQENEQEHIDDTVNAGPPVPAPPTIFEINKKF